jgi:hypothetical protein
MPPRLMHAALAFAVTVAAYQAYVLVVAPFVEPASAAAAAMEPMTAMDLSKAPAALERYRPLLRAYFPRDHWSNAASPIIVENSQAMLVLDTVQKYEQNSAGELRVPRLAVIFFPTGYDRSGNPPRNAIVLEPSGGATLQMDQQLGEGQSIGAMGRMQYGQLLGAVTLRSDMKEQGPQDDLLIETRDLYMNEELIRTTEAVTLRLGPHHGRGRELVINFVKTEATSSDAPAPLFGKLDSLEVSREVAALIMPGNVTMFGTPTQGSDDTRAAPRRSVADAPAQIDCTGPFRIDFNDYLASFSENVHVQQRHKDGVLDELNAHRLTLYFVPTREWGGDAAPAATGDQAMSFVRFEPASIEAVGSPDKSVELNAPSQGAWARGQQLYIALLQRRVTLKGDDQANVQVNYRDAEIKAPMVQYDLPPRGSSRRLGLMAALGGGGSLRAAPDPRRPGEFVDVRWTQSMQMVRRGEHSVLVLDGRPKVEMPGLGTLWADQLELFLRETATAAAVEEPSGLPARIHVDRITATGHVDIRSSALDGKVSKLDLRIVDAAPAPAQAGVGGPAGAGAGGQVAATSLFERNRAGAAPRTYSIEGRILEIDAVMRERRPQVAAIRVAGGVDFQELPAGATGDAPLKILADRLDVTDADTPDALIEIRGGDAANSLPAGLAEISAQGTVLRAPKLTVNRGKNQAEINSPGEVQMLMTRDVAGQPLAQPQQLRITWRDSMKLDRDRIEFAGNVYVENADGWLKTQRLATVLTAPVQFDGAASAQAPEIAQIECWNGATAEFDQRDAAGNVTSHQHVEIESLTVNQITGAITGVGPGHVDSVHLSKGDGAWALLPNGMMGDAAPPPRFDDLAAPAEPPRLKHLSIDFVRGVEGNIHAPTVRVFGNVRTIYGPVDSWDQRLKMTPGGTPGPDTFWISCESLTVTESPLTRLQPPAADGSRRAFGLIEIVAESRVVIEGIHPQQGAFTVRGGRATYDQAKTLFMLHEDANGPATITYQRTPGGPFEEQPAKKWSYNQTTGELRVEGFKKAQLNLFDPN